MEYLDVFNISLYSVKGLQIEEQIILQKQIRKNEYHRIYVGGESGSGQDTQYQKYQNNSNST